MNWKAINAVVLSLTLVSPFQSFSQDDFVERYLDRIEELGKAHKDNKYAAQIFSDRLDAELAKMPPNYDFVAGYFSRLKKLDRIAFLKYVNELPGYYRRQMHFNSKSNFDQNEFFNFLKRFTSDISEKDGFETTAKIFTDQAKILDLAFFMVLKQKPEPYAAFFEANEKDLLKPGVDRARRYLEMYCLSKRLVGKPLDCVSKLSPYTKKNRLPWLHLALGSAYLTAGNLVEAKKRISNLTSPDTLPCAKIDRQLSWAAFLQAQIFRIEGKDKASELCLEAFNKMERENAKFFYFLEMAKTSRAQNLPSSDNYIQSASQSLPKGMGYTLFHALMDIEKMKNAAIKRDAVETSALKGKILEHLGSSLVDYRRLVMQIDDRFSKKSKRPSIISNFETLDLEALIQTINRREGNLGGTK